MNASGTGKNGRIELLRFVFALFILFFHIHKRFATEAGDAGLFFRFFHHGYIGVEFFFLVSGFLLAAAASRQIGKENGSIGAETVRVTFSRIKKVFPYHLFALIVTMVVNVILIKDTITSRLGYIVDSWASLFFVQILGFDSSWVNTLTWYLDVWIIVSFAFWYFLRRHFDTFIHIVCPLLGLFLLGYLAHEYHSVDEVDVWTGVFYKCFLRGLGEMALGCSAFAFTGYLDRLTLAPNHRRALGALEAVCYLAAFFYSVANVDSKYSFPVIFMLWVAISLSFSKVNERADIFARPVFFRLGAFSLMIFLNQFYVIRLVEYLLPQLTFAWKVVVCTAFTMLGGLLCENIVNRKHYGK